jgi:hypothetical protein
LHDLGGRLPESRKTIQTNRESVNMNWQTYTFIGLLAAVLLGSFYASYSGAMLPGPDSSSEVSLQNVQNRRSHFMTYYAFGK